MPESNFQRVLIANRGEIAVRIAKTLRAMGKEPVGIYSDADADAAHIRACSESYWVGGALPNESYLRTDRILKICTSANIDALHPGYGFLSENAEFAESLAKAGIVLIGPPASAIRAMGSKTEARQKMIEAGVPVVPGSEGAISDINEAAKFAQSVGYPVMLKASAGGGGKGMRLVHDATELETAFRSAQSEAQNAFGDATVFLEKAILSPRHIEIQILSGPDGKTVYLGERECSMQRRHQKVIEESPSPIVDSALREAMGQTAVKAAEAVDYRGAGTVEFLVDADRNYYFLEMNTRLQVEHPVTELCTGIDLVQAQVQVAEGHPLPWTQEDIRYRGHAIEARLYAEAPAKDFMPAPGTVSLWKPPSGPGIRVDSGLDGPAEISRYYDPMIAKIIAWGENREQARRRLIGALEQTVCVGLQTNLAFLKSLAEHKSFVQGHYSTASIAEHHQTLTQSEDISLKTIAAAVIAEHTLQSAGIHPEQNQPSTSQWRALNWRQS